MMCNNPGSKHHKRILKARPRLYRLTILFVLSLALMSVFLPSAPVGVVAAGEAARATPTPVSTATSTPGAATPTAYPTMTTDPLNGQPTAFPDASVAHQVD